MRRSQQLRLRDCIDFNPQVYVFCHFCYKEVVLNSYELHHFGYADEETIDPDPELLMEELEKKLLREGWMLPYKNKRRPMCGECARAFEQLDDMPAN